MIQCVKALMSYEDEVTSPRISSESVWLTYKEGSAPSVSAREARHFHCKSA